MSDHDYCLPLNPGLVPDLDADGDRVVCIKCGKSSGDDWSQCRSSCPVKSSPHFSSVELARCRRRIESFSQIYKADFRYAKHYPTPFRNRHLVKQVRDGKVVSLVGGILTSIEGRKIFVPQVYDSGMSEEKVQQILSLSSPTGLFVDGEVKGRDAVYAISAATAIRRYARELDALEDDADDEEHLEEEVDNG
jgi:hypothetical protein